MKRPGRAEALVDHVLPAVGYRQGPMAVRLGHDVPLLAGGSTEGEAFVRPLASSDSCASP